MAGEGKFCHQCRQKTTKPVFSCKNMRGEKKCCVNVCQPCLKNRYSKITEEAANLDDWKCPKCCGSCNCGVCMKRRGQQPTGRLPPNSEQTSDKVWQSAIDYREPAEVYGTNGEEGNTGSGTDVKGKRKAKAVKEPRRAKAKKEVLEPVVPLPLGVPLTTVAGIELHPQDVGHALQFLEFCGAFEEVLKFSKAQAESLLGNLMRQRSGRPAQYSSIVRLHTTLLSLIQDKEMEDEPSNKNSWFEDLGKCFSESQLLMKELPSDCFSRGGDGYDSLDFSQKLRVLTFICDEALGTKSVRTFYEKEKKAKGKVVAAKDKKKDLNKQLQDEAAKAIISRDDAASTSGHESVVLRLKNEEAEAHAELPEAQGLAPKTKQQSDFVRREPYLFDADGRAFWKLKGYNDGDEVLLQDMGTWDAVASSDEKWYMYGVETKEAVEKYCSSVRTKVCRTRRARRASQKLPSSSGRKEEDLENVSRSGIKEEYIVKENETKEQIGHGNLVFN